MQADGEEFKAIRRGWCLGDKTFREELLESASAGATEPYRAEARRETTEAKARRIGLGQRGLGALSQGGRAEGANGPPGAGRNQRDVEMDRGALANGRLDACGEPAFPGPGKFRQPTRLELVSKVRSDPFTFSYLLAVGAPSTLTVRLGLPNGSYITNNYDSVARLTGTWLKNSTHTTLNSHQYSYNLGNQRTQQVFNTPWSTVNYAYDPIGQLKVADSGTANEDRAYRL